MQALVTSELGPPPELTLSATESRYWGSRTYRRFAFGTLLSESEIRIDALRNTGNEAAWKIAVKLTTCCVNPVIVNLNSGEKFFLAEQRCKSRICPRCSQIRARQLAGRVSDLVREMESPRFLTLTVRSNDQSLQEQLRFLRRRFAVMRRSELWAYHVRGGVYTIEITFNSQTQQWHPHLHAIVDGTYFPHSELLHLWQHIVGDQCGVDIRLVVGVRKISNYLAAYVAKSCDLDRLAPNELAEWAIQTHGLRLAQTFGSFHGVKAVEVEADESAYRSMDLDVNWVITLANSGCEVSRQIINHLTGNHQLLADDFLDLVEIFQFGKKGSNRKIAKPANLQQTNWLEASA